MARTYDLADLALNDVTSANWALATARFILRDTPNEAAAYPEGSLEDEEISAFLEATKETDTIASGGDGAVYYFPHEAAAKLILSNPEWVTSRNYGGFSESKRTAGSIARGIRAAYDYVNTAILDATDGRLGGTSPGLRL